MPSYKSYQMLAGTLLTSILGVEMLSGQPAGSQLVYGRGQVMTAPLSVYFLWYGRSSSTHMSTITTFTRNISGSPWFSMVSTFTDVYGRRIPNSFPLVAAAFDDQYSYGHNFGQADEQAFIKRSIDTGRLPFDPNGVYVVLTAPDVTVDNNGSTCAYHHSFGFRGTNLKYAVIINPASSGTPAGCNLFRSVPPPNGNGATDSMIHFLGHELVETVTNPTGDGWTVSYPQGFAEVVDVCEGTGTRAWEQRLSNGAIYTVFDSGRYYHLPAVFKNTGRANCSIR